MSARSTQHQIAALAIVLAATAAFGADARSRLAYPPARKAAVVDDYSGEVVKLAGVSRK